ncbi:MAG: hypothetical protein ACRC1W_16930 [Shewanella sp.]
MRAIALKAVAKRRGLTAKLKPLAKCRLRPQSLKPTVKVGGKAPKPIDFSNTIMHLALVAMAAVSSSTPISAGKIKIY